MAEAARVARTMVPVAPVRLVEVREDGTPAESGLVLPPAGVEALAATASLYGRVGFQPPWVGYLAVQGEAAVGTCAFTGPPTDNRVEIAYFTFPTHEGRGVATHMAQALVAVARRTRSDVLITAHTLPQPSASTRILSKLHFACIAQIQHPEDGTIWEWHLEFTPSRDGPGGGPSG
jgi:[ribosomal protein S5]-alanine N-acetyltransferase